MKLRTSWSDRADKVDKVGIGSNKPLDVKQFLCKNLIKQKEDAAAHTVL